MITLVVGAPGSGKTTYISTHCAPGDVIIDLDLIASTTGGDTTLAKRLRVAAEENARYITGRDVWIARTFPNPVDEEEFSRRVGVDRIVSLGETPREEVERRLVQRGDWDSQAEAVNRWYDNRNL